MSIFQTLSIRREYIHLLFFADDFSGFLIFIYFFNERFKICLNNRWCFIRFMALRALQLHKNLCFDIIIYKIQVDFLFGRNENNSDSVNSHHVLGNSS